MAPGLDPYFSKITLMQFFLCLFGELVVEVLRPIKTNRNPRMSTWLWAWLLSFTKCYLIQNIWIGLSLMSRVENAWFGLSCLNRVKICDLV